MEKHCSECFYLGGFRYGESFTPMYYCPDRDKFFMAHKKGINREFIETMFYPAVPSSAVNKYWWYLAYKLYLYKYPKSLPRFKKTLAIKIKLRERGSYKR